MNVMKQPAACYFVFIRDDQQPLNHTLYLKFFILKRASFQIIMKV